MKRLVLPVAALALVLGLSVGCSKTADTAATAVPGANVDVDKMANDAQKCADLLTGYAGLYAPLLAGGSDAEVQKTTKALEDMKAKVPDKIKTDLDTIESGLKNAKGLTEVGTFLSSDQYKKADKEITDYFTNECNKVGK